jgi:hypothetical protein
MLMIVGKVNVLIKILCLCFAETDIVVDAGQTDHDNMDVLSGNSGDELSGAEEIGVILERIRRQPGNYVIQVDDV